MKSLKFRRSPYGGVMVTRDGVDWHVLLVKRGAPSSYASTAHWQAAKGGSWQVVAVPAGAPVGGYHQQAWPFNDGATARAAALALPAPAFAQGPRSNPDPARAQILEPLFGAGRKLVRAVNRGAGPDVEGALLARARAAAREADAHGLPGSRILRAMLKEMKSRQVGIWRNPVAVPVGQGLIVNRSGRSPTRR